ncbi:LysR substrate-binding domain-containing protein [Desulfovibrio sp. JC010]|uniref:LysR substrate-binding domain-containing protein n=1 Tax=Desulfovibrio sp. JC010 TaxID=2593641 RepID=UPI0013D3FF00|nr:LysR substrate-binding domain-containing protein [Desulfovibrio sp. JC010]NDV26189.1 LysR family transcriptional regulator [Desulfovibrio sp. JC010]
MKPLPPLSPLVSFRAAAANLSFTKAAAELHLTHGAVSKAVKQLEEYYGLKLFHRRNRAISLTSKGRFLFQHVDRMLNELEEVSEQMRIAENGQRISVSCEPSLSMRWLMPHLEHFHKKFPGTEIHISTAGGPIDLSSEGVHLAIRRSDFSWPAGYHALPLGRERIGPVCSPSYWQKNKHQALKILHTRTRKEAWSDWEQYSGKILDAESEQFYDHFYFSLQAAVAGLGMGMGPEPLVADDLESGLLVAPYGFVETPISYVVLSLNKIDEDKQLNDFVSWVREHIPLEKAGVG